MKRASMEPTCGFVEVIRKIPKHAGLQDGPRSLCIDQSKDPFVGDTLNLFRGSELAKPDRISIVCNDEAQNSAVYSAIKIEAVAIHAVTSTFTE
jgi:hypothetical protein